MKCVEDYVAAYPFASYILVSAVMTLVVIPALVGLIRVSEAHYYGVTATEPVFQTFNVGTFVKFKRHSEIAVAYTGE